MTESAPAPGSGEKPLTPPTSSGSSQPTAEEGLSPVKPAESELLVITGMSGAGRSTAADALEDSGWYVVENLPPQMLVTLSDLVARTPQALPKLAVVVDVRTYALFSDIRDSLSMLASAGTNYRMLFLDASDEVLVRRFEQGRRPHPLQGDGRILDGIAAEREVLAVLRDNADVVLDSSNLNVHELAKQVNEIFSDTGPVVLRLTLMSFGFKYGLPADANYVADVRFLPNPHWVPQLRHHTGLDPDVSDYVLKQNGADEFISKYVSALEPVLAGYRRENKHYTTIAVGCTGGKHRSVAMTMELAKRLAQLPRVTVSTRHRDLGRE